jgi:hypothetical protein
VQVSGASYGLPMLYACMRGKFKRECAARQPVARSPLETFP